MSNLNNSNFSNAGNWITPTLPINNNPMHVPYVPLINILQSHEEFQICDDAGHKYKFYKYNYECSKQISNLFNKIENMANNKLHRNLFITSEIFKVGSNYDYQFIEFENNYIRKILWEEKSEKCELYFNPDNHYIRIVFKYHIPNKTDPSVYTFLFKRYKIIYDCKNDELIFSGDRFKKINEMFDEDVFDDECVGIFDNKSLINRDAYKAIFSKYKLNIQLFQLLISAL